MKYGYRVEAMQCKNMGGSYGDAEDTQWSCTAEIPDDFKLGRTEVVCEGYASPDDPYVLKGITFDSMW
jgi:store-operated calcium entry-associated regulatory factor